MDHADYKAAFIDGKVDGVSVLCGETTRELVSKISIFFAIIEQSQNKPFSRVIAFSTAVCQMYSFPSP